ncbi:MAG: DUF4442 domain-containing protein [Candidatus Binatia bacterium]
MIRGIPYLQLHELEVDADPETPVVVAMELRPALTNYIGILHAGALFTAAETAAGIAAHRLVADQGGFVLLREATVRYTKRAEGRVTVRARINPERECDALRTFASEGRANVVVTTAMTDARGVGVFEASFDYALRRSPS